MPARFVRVSFIMPALMPAFFSKMPAQFVRVSFINASSNASFFERNIARPVRIAIIWAISLKETAPEAALCGRWPDFLGWASRKIVQNREKVQIQTGSPDFLKIVKNRDFEFGFRFFRDFWLILWAGHREKFINFRKCQD